MDVPNVVVSEGREVDHDEKSLLLFPRMSWKVKEFGEARSFRDAARLQFVACSVQASSFLHSLGSAITARFGSLRVAIATARRCLTSDVPSQWRDCLTVLIPLDHDESDTHSAVP